MFRCASTEAGCALRFRNLCAPGVPIGRSWIRAGFPALVALAASCVLSAFAADPTASEYQTFIDEFFSPANIENYISTIDDLVDAGSTRVFENAAALETGNGPATKITANGIQMVFSIFPTDEGLAYHLALSRKEQLPRGFAATLVAAFADRAGLVLPMVIKVGENQSFHVVWEVPHKYIETDARIVEELRTRSRRRTDAQQVFSDATINARNIRIETLIP